MSAASFINQFRVHSGYHYPRSSKTIEQVLESREIFLNEFKKCVSKKTDHYYAIPYNDTKTTPKKFEEIANKYSLYLKKTKPGWIDNENLDSAYKKRKFI